MKVFVRSPNGEHRTGAILADDSQCPVGAFNEHT
jgi:hypothetical protein